jgi:primosomal protein N' (replication factor Y)
MYADIILPVPLNELFTYSVPASLEHLAVPGARVYVPFGKGRRLTGLIIRTHGNKPTQHETKEILSVLDDTCPSVLPQQLKLMEWMSRYYICPPGDVFKAALPSGLRPDSSAKEQLYKPRITVFVRLGQNSSPEFGKTAVKQKELYERFLELSGIKDDFSQTKPVTKRALMEGSKTASSFRALEDNGILETYEVETGRLPQFKGSLIEPAALSEAQQKALDGIHESFKSKNVCLLHGVTSSGKTEVYIHLIREMLAQGKQVLYLVPEIALTTQLTDRLKKVFSKQLGVYHSRFSDMERVEIYKDLLNSTEPKVILSARSGVFLPFRNLGLVIVDEEHDSSFKQQDPAPRYHARSVAVVMAKAANASVLLGTATPAIESYYNAQTGKYRLVEMSERYAGLSLPRIGLVDLKRQYHRKEMFEHFADPLVERINKQLAEGKQIIIFQNRRGYAPYIGCKRCGYVPKCCNCDVSLTYHKRTNTLVCHYCGYTVSAPQSCPNCQGEWRDFGVGTEKIEDEVTGLFPEARVARMDLDTTRNKNSHQRIINAFARHEVDILIGTQMVTKGLHFNDVSLVAVLNADSMMQSPDFRSSERAFQMLEQVAGRAGRTGSQGEVIIQTFQPDNPLYAYLQKHDYKSFYTAQLGERKTFRFPPFYRLVVLTLKHRDYTRLDTAARELSERLRKVFGNRCSDVIIPPIARVQNMHLRTIRLRIEANASFAQAKAILMQHVRYVQTLPNCKGTVIQPDVDPM